jgi:hypothetical protein
MIRLGTLSVATDQYGYFAMMVPCSDPQAEQCGYAHNRPATDARLFLWSRAKQSDYSLIVLEWVSSVRGRVVDREGKPQSSIRVGLCPHLSARAGQTWPQGKQTGTDAQGHFVFEAVPVGVPLDVILQNPNEAEIPMRVPIDDLTPDQKYDLGDIVLKHP